MREEERQIEADLFDHIVTNGGNYTVLELMEKYVSLKTGARYDTAVGDKTVINVLKKEAFGKMRIDKVRLSDIQMAVDDDLIRKNPFGYADGCPSLGEGSVIIVAFFRYSRVEYSK